MSVSSICGLGPKFSVLLSGCVKVAASAMVYLCSLCQDAIPPGRWQWWSRLYDIWTFQHFNIIYCSGAEVWVTRCAYCRVADLEEQVIASLEAVASLEAALFRSASGPVVDDVIVDVDIPVAGWVTSANSWLPPGSFPLLIP